MRRYGKLFATLAIGMVVMMSAVDFAEARRAGSGFGSRGTRTFDSAPATRTAPAPAAPIERTMTPQSQATRPLLHRMQRRRHRRVTASSVVSVAA